MFLKSVIRFAIVGLAVLSVLGTIGCSSGDKGALVWVWYPNESTPERAASRAAIIEVVSEAIGRNIEEQLTTDYSIAIESIVHGNAAMSWLGGEGYVRANSRDQAIQALVVHTGESGSLDDAKYYAMLGARKENGGDYIKDGEYSLETFRQKNFSFVSNSSTSGFVVPSSIISSHFNVESEELLEGGRGKVFSEVLFGGSHQGALLNVLEKRADVGAFCNTCIAHYMSFTKGDFGDPKPGDVFRINNDAVAPFDRFAGEEIVLVATVPVLNECVVVNGNILSEDEIEKIRKVLTSDEVTNNRQIFGSRKDAQNPSFFEAGQRFVPVEDAWYNPVRVMSGLPLR